MIYIQNGVIHDGMSKPAGMQHWFTPAKVRHRQMIIEMPHVNHSTDYVRLGLVVDHVTQ